MKNFIEFLVHHLVDNPDQVKINEIRGSSTVIFELHVASTDLGKVIGKHGQTAQSLRTLVMAVAAKNGQRALLEIMEERVKDKKTINVSNNV